MPAVVKALRWHPKLTRYIRNIRIFLALNYTNSILDSRFNILICIRHSGVDKISIEIEPGSRFFVGLTSTRQGRAYRKPNLLR